METLRNLLGGMGFAAAAIALLWALQILEWSIAHDPTAPPAHHAQR